MTVNECISYVERHLEVRYATENGAYKANRRMTVRGCVNHSYGVAQPSVEVFFKNMNKSTAKWGVNAVLGDFHLGEGRIVLLIPLNVRPWGCGAGSRGSYNTDHVQWETLEPAGHTYKGGTMIGYDVKKNQPYFDRMWKMLVCWNVYVIKKFGYPVSAISDHAEAHAAGYATNHADMGQWLPKHGKSMDALRAEVRRILETPVGDDIEEDEDMLTGEEIYKRLSEHLSAKQMDDWEGAKEEFQEAVDRGITDGRDPMQFVPRYQAAIMAKRAAEK